MTLVDSRLLHVAMVMRTVRFCAYAASVITLLACEDAPKPSGTLIPDAGQSANSVTKFDAEASDAQSSESGVTHAGADCKGKADGTACDKNSDEDRHCQKQKCVARSNPDSGPDCGSKCTTLMPCGNGELEHGEECDDGNQVADDKCSNSCTENICGNKRVDANEECDDGNSDNADTCSNGCLRIRCRNGRVDEGEECDDGNAIDSDGCNNRCLVMKCGDGEAQDREECDDGNDVDDDDCSILCTQNECGNLRLDPGEECDGDGLGCSATCTKQTDPCRPCEEMHCRKYTDFEIDLLAGCYENNPNPDITQQPAPGADEFSGPCTKVLACARGKMCVESNMKRGPGGCLCGTADATTCEQSEQPDAACYVEIAAGAQSTDYTQVILRTTDMRYPVGYAWNLLLCDLEFCRAQCLPWLKE